jgi:hypothetical protein
MVDRSPALESLTAQERIVLMGRLWESLDPAAGATALSSTLVVRVQARTEIDEAFKALRDVVWVS